MGAVVFVRLSVSFGLFTWHRAELTCAVEYNLQMSEVVKIVTNHEGPKSGSPSQPPPEVGDLSAQRVEGRTVERCTGILGQ